METHKIICKECGELKKEEDFYWHVERNIPTLKNPNCKSCISKENKKKYQEKKEELYYAF